MTTDDATLIDTPRPSKADGPLQLRVRGATDEQLDLGLAAARQSLAARGVTAGHAVVCHSAVAAYELDPALPEPDASVRAGAEACREAYVAAVLAAGGTLDGGDELAFEQGPEERRLWDTLPTLHAWRVKNNSPSLSEPQDAASPLA